MKRMPFAAILVPVLCCSPGTGAALGDDPVKATPPRRPATPPARAIGSRPTEQECLDLAQHLKERVDAGDAAEFNGYFDWTVVLDRATADVGTPQFRAAFNKGIMQTLPSPEGFAAKLVQSMQGGDFDLLRLRTQRGQRTALFRAIDAEGAVNYYEMELAKRPGGHVKVVDVYPFAAGELVSQSLRRNFISMVGDASRGFIAKLTTSEEGFLKNADKIQAMSKAEHEHRPADALEIYRGLPAAVQKNKTVLLLRLRAAMAMNDQEHEAAIEAIRTNFPGDPSLDLLTIDAYFIKKKYKEVIASVDRLDRNVGGDPYLDVLRANAYVALGDLETARKLAVKAVSNVPEILTGHWTFVTVTLKQKDFDGTLKALKQIGNTFEAEFSDLRTIPDYAEFCKSPQFQEWLKYLNEAKKAAPAAPPSGGGAPPKP